MYWTRTTSLQSIVIGFILFCKCEYLWNEKNFANNNCIKQISIVGNIVISEKRESIYFIAQEIYSSLLISNIELLYFSFDFLRFSTVYLHQDFSF